MPQQPLLATAEGPPLSSSSFSLASAAEIEFARGPLAVGSALDSPAPCRCEDSHTMDHGVPCRACLGSIILLFATSSS